jgi:hypothetical protein
MVHEFPLEHQTSICKVTAKFYQFHARKRISSISSLASNVIVEASAHKGISHNHLSRTSTTLIQHVDVELALANITAVGIQTGSRMNPWPRETQAARHPLLLQPPVALLHAERCGVP